MKKNPVCRRLAVRLGIVCLLTAVLPAGCGTKRVFDGSGVSDESGFRMGTPF